jgi:hypothetical protein
MLLMPAKRQVTEQKTLLLEKSGAVGAIDLERSNVRQDYQNGDRVMRERRSPESKALRTRTSWLRAMASHKEYPPTGTCLGDGYLAEREKFPGTRLTVTLDLGRAGRRR